MLTIQGLNKWFGGLKAVQDLNLTIQPGEFVGVIGPNGAGKTTLFNLISGFLKPTSGTIVFNGENMTGLKPFQRADKGLIRTFQSSTLIFAKLSVLENIRVGSYCQGKTNIIRTLWGGYRSAERDRVTLQHASRIMDLTELSAMKSHLAQNLSHGYRRILGVAVALAGQPKLLMMDEPTTGMNAQEVQKMVAIIKKIHEQGVTILLVEHNMHVVGELCQRVMVLNFGKKIAEGTCEEIRTDREVIRAYLGGIGC